MRTNGFIAGTGQIPSRLVGRHCRLAADSGVVSAYLHAGPAPALGRMGALLALEASGAAS